MGAKSFRGGAVLRLGVIDSNIKHGVEVVEWIIYHQETLAFEEVRVAGATRSPVERSLIATNVPPDASDLFFNLWIRMAMVLPSVPLSERLSTSDPLRPWLKSS